MEGPDSVKCPGRPALCCSSGREACAYYTLLKAIRAGANIFRPSTSIIDLPLLNHPVTRITAD